MADETDLVARLKVAGSGAFKSDMDRAGRSVRGLGTDASRADRKVGLMGRAAARADHSTRGLGRGVKSTGSSMRGIAGWALGFVAVGGAVRKMGSEYQEAVKTTANVKATIKSTGGVAGVTAKHVDRLSASLSRQTAVDDEVIAQSSNLLLTFKAIKREGGIFDRATTSALDISAKGFGSVESASKMLGKALNDPIKGMTALGRAGITFTEEQTKSIEAMVETGDVLGAQKIIMKEVESQTGGTAKAIATPMDRLRTNSDNLAESMGRLAAPAANKGLTALADLSGAIDKIASRKDLSLEEKLKLAGGAARRIFDPLVDGASAAIGRMHLGEKFGKAVEDGVPIMATSFANAAPRAARAFVTAFKESGPWGKLLTAGFLVTKMSPAFTIASGIMTRRMLKNMSTNMGTGASAAGLGTLAGKPGLVASMKSLGKGLGLTAALAAGFEFSKKLTELLGEFGTTGDLAALASTAPIVGGTAGFVAGNTTTAGALAAKEERENPTDTSGAGSSVTGTGGLPGGFPGRSASARIGSRPPAMSGGGATIVIESTMDGQKVGRGVARVSLRDLVNA